ncbi:MAG: hypothetical protein KJ072_12140 [Verrucomicrobia bacterium]|nr:hypothetical protein [Verrucomicrobiota bacterium]
MNHESSHGPNANLDSLLRDWRVDDPLPLGFNRAVWRRIAAQAVPAPVSPVAALRLRLDRWFARPAWSIGCALFLVSAGLLAGYWQATAQTARWEQLMASRYVHSVDPYAQAASAP